MSKREIYMELKKKSSQWLLGEKINLELAFIISENINDKSGKLKSNTSKKENISHPHKIGKTVCIYIEPSKY